MFSISFNPKEIWCRMKLRNQLILVRMVKGVACGRTQILALSTYRKSRGAEEA